MDAVATVYRLAASLSPGTDRLLTQVDFHRRGRFDATITRHDGRSFGVVRRGPACGGAPPTTGCEPSQSTSTGAAPARSWS